MDPYRGTKWRPAALPYDVQKVVVKEEELQEWSSILDQEDPDLPHIKEEQEELWTGREGEPEEADNRFTFIPVAVKSEHHEGELQSSQLHQRQVEWMIIAADGRSERARNSHPGRRLKSVNFYKLSKMPVAEVGVRCDWEETDGFQSGLNSLENNEDMSESETDEEMSDSSETNESDPDWTETRDRKSASGKTKDNSCNSSKVDLVCTECGKEFANSRNLAIHMKIHTGEKFLRCPELSRENNEDMSESETDEEMSDSSETNESDPDCTETQDRKSASGKTKDNSCNSSKVDLVCTECGKEFANSRNLAIHMKIHTGEKFLRCPELSRENNEDMSESETDEEMSDSSETNESDPDWTETQDRKSASGKTKDNSCNSSKVDLVCTECGKEFANSRNLAIHMKIHTGEKFLRCPECGKRFLNWSLLMPHIRIHAGEKSFRPYACSLCEQAFLRSSHLNSHMRSCGRPKAARQSQAVLDEDTSDCSSDGEMTSESTGTDKETSESTGTDEESSDSTGTDEETSKSAGMNEETFKSTRTDKETTSDSSETDEETFDSFKTDEQTSDSTETDENSDSSGTNDLDKDRNKTQVPESVLNETKSNSRNSAKKAFSCHICGKGFACSRNVTRHMIVHNREKPFRCPVCSERFFKEPHLEKHIRVHKVKKNSKHPPDKRFMMCPECGKTVLHRNVRRHMRVHEENPFTCPTCKKWFPGSSNLTKHMKSHAKGCAFRCDNCEKSFPRLCLLNKHMCFQYVQPHQRQTEQLNRSSRRIRSSQGLVSRPLSPGST